MLEFKKVTLSSLPELAPFLETPSYRVCDYSLATFYMWSDYFDCTYCVFADTLFVRSSNNGKLTFSLPLGKLSVSESIRILLDYTDSLSIPLVLTYVPKAAIPLFDEFSITTEKHEGFSDYLYTASDLASLPGKKYHRKKNKINKFLSNYSDISYSRITPENISKVIDFFTEYVKKTVDPSDFLIYEQEHCLDALKNYFSFKLVGGVLSVGTKVVAFTFAEIIGDTAIVHIEKCDRTYDGGYEMINKLFSEDIAKSFPITFINREEDMNDLGLRQAKLSYNPVMLLDKYVVTVGGTK